MVEMIFSILILAAGASLIICSIISRIRAHTLPNPQKWIKTTAIITGELNYTERGYPTGTSFLSDSSPHEHEDTLICYMAEGKEYSGSIHNECDDDTIEIYFKRNDPKFFRTAKEMEERRSIALHNGAFLLNLLFGVVFMLLGSVLLYDTLNGKFVMEFISDTPYFY